MEKWIIVFVIIAFLLLSFYLLDNIKKYNKEPTQEQLKAEKKALCYEGCDWEEECVKEKCKKV